MKRKKLTNDPSQRLDEPVTQEELKGIIREGIAANPTIVFQTVSFSEDLVPFDKGEQPRKKVLVGSRGSNRFYLYAGPEKKGLGMVMISSHLFPKFEEEPAFRTSQGQFKDSS